MMTFPIMGKRLGDPKLYIPWDFAERARAQAFKNHDQTLERLAERGGLDPVEFFGAANGKSWIEVHYLDHDACLEWIKSEVKKWESK